MKSSKIKKSSVHVKRTKNIREIADKFNISSVMTLRLLDRAVNKTITSLSKKQNLSIKDSCLAIIEYTNMEAEEFSSRISAENKNLLMKEMINEDCDENVMFFKSLFS